MPKTASHKPAAVRQPAPSAVTLDEITLLTHIQRQGRDGCTMDELRAYFGKSEQEIEGQLSKLGKKIVAAFRQARRGHSPKIWRDACYGNR